MSEIYNREAKFTFRDVSIDQKKNVLTAPLGLKIDLGGIAKGYWVDQIKDLLDQQSSNYWISAGGDIYVKGNGVMNEGWQVAIQNPQDLGEDILSLTVPSQGYGIATSGVTKRQGIHNGEKWHHIIDPRTDTQVENSILSVTVIAKTTTGADIMAKTVLILGIENGLSMIHGKHDTECVIVDKDLKMHISKGLIHFL
jgi:thiamine biosynthesis lipoprotein